MYRGCLSNNTFRRIGLKPCSLESESASYFLLVICLITFIHQDLWYGKLVPSTHLKGKPSHTILCAFSRSNHRIWKGIPISDCLREEWTHVNVSSCSGGFKSQWFLLRLIGGIRSSVGMLAAPFRPLYKRISLLALLPLLRDAHFSFFFFFFFFSVFKSYSQFQSNNC